MWAENTDLQMCLFHGSIEGSICSMKYWTIVHMLPFQSRYFSLVGLSIKNQINFFSKITCKAPNHHHAFRWKVKVVEFTFTESYFFSWTIYSVQGQKTKNVNSSNLLFLFWDDLFFYETPIIPSEATFRNNEQFFRQNIHTKKNVFYKKKRNILLVFNFVSWVIQCFTSEWSNLSMFRGRILGSWKGVIKWGISGCFMHLENTMGGYIIHSFTS